MKKIKREEMGARRWRNPARKGEMGRGGLVRKMGEMDEGVSLGEQEGVFDKSCIYSV